MAAETSIVSGIAGRYASALFALAEEARQLDAVAADLTGLSGLIADSADLRRLIYNPLFQRAARRDAFLAVLERAGVSDLVRRFAGVICNNQRLYALPGIITAFHRLLARHRGEMAAEVTAAQPLTEAQLDTLRAALQQATGAQVSLKTRVDETLIGGLLVKVGSRMVDSSVRTKLQNLALAMKGVG